MKDDIKKVIKSILIEFQERDFPKPIFRDVFPPKELKNIKKVWVLMGMRRSGKTWVAYQQMRQRENQGFSKDTNLYINFEDDRLDGFKIRDFQTILDIYFELYPHNINKENLFFCFDEIHVIPGWEKFIRRLIDTEKMQICVTGSSAEMLSKELSTTLGGRAWPQEIFPFSFFEYLRFNGIEPNSEMSFKLEGQVKNLANEYLIYGGFPEVIVSAKEILIPLIQEYMDAVVLRDIVKRYSINNADVVQKFLVRILRQLAAPLSITKMHGSMKSLGIAVGKNSLFEYFQYFEDAYAILSVPFFSLSESVRQKNPKKIYAIDTGIITAYSVKNHFEKAARLENAVFMHLRRSYKNICYYKTKKDGGEIDFVITKPNGDLFLVQACLEFTSESTKQREILPLIEACKEFDLNEGYIITQDYEEDIIEDNITIKCIPYWKWAQTKI